MTDKRIIDNQRYNAERKAQSELMKRDLYRDKILTKIYQEGYDRIQSQIDQFYMSYAGQNGLTKQEAMKRVSDFDVTKFNHKAAEAVRAKDFSPETNAWLKIYNLKMRVSRLELLKAELELEIQNLTAEVNEVFEKALRSEQEAEFRRQAGILGNSAGGSKKRLEAILGADFYGQKFSSRVWGGLGLRAALQRDVFGSLNRIYTDMMGYKQERDRLAKKFGTSKANAQRLLKTEIARINADTQLAMLQDNGFTHMIFVAEPGACDLCGPLDQKAIPIDQVEKGVNMFPMHPNCRCSAYGHIKLNYKKGGSTLDDYELWEKDKETAQGIPQKQVSGEGRKALPYAGPYRSVKEEWLANADLSKTKVSDMTFWEHDGVIYPVDGHNVKFTPSKRERELAEIVAKTLGRHVQLNPKVENPSSVQVPDYLIDGVRYDAKEIEKTGKNNIDTAIKGQREQARSFVIDITKTPMGVDEALERIGRIYRNYNRRWVENIIVIEGDEIIDIFGRT